MKELEDSTLSLIYRRKVRSVFPAYVVLALILGSFAALPLVKVDVHTRVKGMVRPGYEPAEIFSSVAGMVDRSALLDNKMIVAGDTLVWMNTDLLRARMSALQNRISIHNTSVTDIRLILENQMPHFTSHYVQSHRNHLANIASLEIQKKFLQDEYETSLSLFNQQVISRHEYEQSLRRMREVCAKESDLKEAYKSRLEESLLRIKLEITQLSDELSQIHTHMKEYYLIAPVSGSLYNSRSLSNGSVIQAGRLLALISPTGLLVAECFIDPGHISSVKKGTIVKLRFDDSGFRTHHPIETRVDLLDQEISLFNGIPAYRIRCTLDDSPIYYANGSQEIVRKGMTFTASFILFRRSMAALILEKANLWVTPTESIQDHETRP